MFFCVSLSLFLSLYQCEPGDESMFWSVSHFSYLDLGGTWHGRGQRLWALTTVRQTSHHVCIHLIKQVYSRSFTLQALIKVVNQLHISGDLSRKQQQQHFWGQIRQSETKVLTETYNIKIFNQIFYPASFKSWICSVLFFALINRIKVNFDQYHWTQCLVVKPPLIPPICQIASHLLVKTWPKWILEVAWSHTLRLCSQKCNVSRCFEIFLLLCHQEE